MSADDRTPRCKACSAPIRWAMTQKGKRMPLDLEPSEAGTWVLDGEVANLLARPVRDAAIWPRYIPHWATCPSAPLFRGAGQ